MSRVKSESQIDQYRKLRKRRGRFLSLLIVALLVLAITIGAVSFYGDHVGDFVIMVEKDTVMSLSLSETRDFRNSSTTLRPQGIKGQTNVSYFDLPLDKTRYPEFTDADGKTFYPFETHPGGDSSDRLMQSYFAYTFYLKNTSRAVKKVNYTVTISIRKVVQNVDEAMRVMLIRNRDVLGVEGNKWIFAKQDRDKDGNRLTGEHNVTTTTWDEIYYSTPFVSSEIVGVVEIKDLPAQEIDDYTVVMWLEGDDPDCTNSILGGKVMLDMNFAIVE